MGAMRCERFMMYRKLEMESGGEGFAGRIRGDLPPRAKRHVGDFTSRCQGTRVRGKGALKLRGACPFHRQAHPGPTGGRRRFLPARSLGKRAGKMKGSGDLHWADCSRDDRGARSGAYRDRSDRSGCEKRRYRYVDEKRRGMNPRITLR